MALIKLTAISTKEQVAQDLHPVLRVETVEQVEFVANLHVECIRLTLVIGFVLVNHDLQHQLHHQCQEHNHHHLTYAKKIWTWHTLYIRGELFLYVFVYDYWKCFRVRFLEPFFDSGV